MIVIIDDEIFQEGSRLMSSIFAHILAGLSAIFRFLQFTGRTAAEVGYSVISAVFGFVFKLVQRAF